MRFPFIGPSYQSASLNADVQMSMNLFPEVVESGAGKNNVILLGTPGLKLFTTLPLSPIRGLWAGENRLFAVAGNSLFEVFSNGTYNNRGFVGNDGLPARIIPNGNQLAVISAGQFWIDNGSGPVAAVFGQILGVVSTSGTAVSYVSGDLFQAGGPNGDLNISAGDQMTINGVVYSVSSVTNSTSLVLGSSAGTQTNVLYSVADLNGTVNTAGTAVTWETGDTFDVTHMVGATILINGVNYTVLSVTSPTSLTLTSSAGTQTGVAYGSNPLVTASSGGFLDGYFLVSDAFSSKTFRISALLDGTTWDELDFATKEGYPDNISTIYCDHEELYLFGNEESSEVWQDTGAANFPFQRDPGAFMHFGCAAPFSVCRLGTGGVAWIAGDVERGAPMAMYAQGFQPIRISTHAIEQAWAQYPQVSDAVAFSYIDQGHHFWVVTFPSGNATWVYDKTASDQMGVPMWHQRGWWNGASLDRHRAMFHAYVGFSFTNNPLSGQHYVGDWQNGNIYTMSMSDYNDNGTAIHRIRTTPHTAQENLRAFFSRFELMADLTGTIIPTMDFSVDFGNTYINPRQISSNQPGVTNQLNTRLIWWRNGVSRDRVWRVTITDQVKVALIDAYYEAELGTN